MHLTFDPARKLFGRQDWIDRARLKPEKSWNKEPNLELCTILHTSEMFSFLIRGRPDFVNLHFLSCKNVFIAKFTLNL